MGRRCLRTGRNLSVHPACHARGARITSPAAARGGQPLFSHTVSTCQSTAGLSEREVEIFLDALLAMAEPLKTHFLWRPQLRDPGDEMVLEAAVNGRADALVTFSVRDFGTVPARFGIELIIPREAIGRIRGRRKQ